MTTSCGRWIRGSLPVRHCGVPGENGAVGKLCGPCAKKWREESAGDADIFGAIPTVEICDADTQPTIMAVLAEPTIAVGDEVAMGRRASWLRVEATDPKGWTVLAGGAPATRTTLRLTTYAVIALIRLQAAFVRRGEEGTR